MLEMKRSTCAAMTSDPEVMRYFGVLREGAASDAWIDRKLAHWEAEILQLVALNVPYRGIVTFLAQRGTDIVHHCREALAHHGPRIDFKQQV